MSVIAGLIRFTGAPVHSRELVLAADRLQAPGVAEPRYWFKDGAALLVRQRLVTPEDEFERQPWVGGSSHFVLVCDGRIDNREELAAALNLNIATASEVLPDTKLLLLALERWGESALKRVIGDFAFAFWDGQQRKLMLACDQMGGRALFYHHGADFVAFASTYRALLALPGVPQQIDELGVADLLVYNNHHPDRTMYAGVRRVPPACALTFDRQGMRLNRYWSLAPRNELHLSSSGDYVAAMREQLDRAVACRLRSRAPIASMVTGGLDSSAVTATAAKQLAPSRLTTLTSVPPDGLSLPQNQGWYNDERPFVQAIAGMHANLDTRLVSSEQPHWIEIDPTAMFERTGRPRVLTSNIGWLLPGLERIAAEGITVLLNGEGGNGAWSWNGLATLYDMFKQGHWLRLSRELYLTGQNRPYGKKSLDLLRSEIVRPLITGAMSHWRLRATPPQEAWMTYSAINPDFARDIRLAEHYRQAGQMFRGVHAAADSIGLRLDMLKRIQGRGELDMVLRALTGVEARAPLLDIRLLEFCLTVPPEQFLQRGVHRHLTKAALADRLPVAVLRNNLLGRQNPEIYKRMAAMRTGVLEEIRALRQISLASHILDLPRLEKIAKDWSDSMQHVMVLTSALHVGRFLRWAEKEMG